MNRLRSSCWIFALCLASAAAASAQRPGGRSGGELELKPGDRFPHVDIHDASGAPYNTKSLKGFFTVVVSGCLT